MLVSVGERISCALAAMAIIDLGHEATSLTGSQAGIVTDATHTKAKIVEVRAHRIHEALDRGEIVLVAGFQGVSTESHDVTTLGRGGSDTTAVALAAALGADACEIYTDVERRLHGRPARRPGRAQARRGQHEEMLEMAASGARCMPPAPSRSRATTMSTCTSAPRSRTGTGTWIREEDERMLEKAIISGVVHTARGDRLPRRAASTPRALFGALAEARVNVDTIVQTGPRSSSPRRSRTRPTRGARARRARRAGRRATTSARCSVIGAGMKSHPGVAAKTFATLEREGIEPPSSRPRRSRSRATSRPARSTARCRRCTRRSSLR